MNRKRSKTRRWIMVSLTLLFLSCSFWFTFTVAETAAASQLDDTLQTEPFLHVPYFNATERTAYMDNDGVPYTTNDILLLYDERQLISGTHGICNDNSSAVAYFAEPQNPQAECIWYDGHTGNDFGIGYEPVLAAASGIVANSGWARPLNRRFALGLYIELEHENGYFTRYGHMSAVITKTTDLFVSQGQMIGNSGNSGNSGGPHLHFEVFQRIDGAEIFVDPFNSSAYLWEDGFWFAGQWAGRQVQPSYNITHVVDNDDPTYFVKGKSLNEFAICPREDDQANPRTCPAWYIQLAGGIDNQDSYWTYATESRDYWATWTPPEPGPYLVEAFIPRITTQTWGARYCPYSTVYNDPIPFCVLVDQFGSQGQWVPLGNVWFAESTDVVRLYDQTIANANEVQFLRQVGVDAVRFRGIRLDQRVYLPIVQSGGNVTTGQ